jgi:DNA-binding phage protein
MRDDINEDARAVQKTLRENEFANHETVAKLMTDYIERGGLAPSQARTLALRRVRTSGMTYESLAEAAGISRGAFDKTSSDANRNVREARELTRLTRDDYPVGLVGEFAIAMGAEPYVDDEYDRVFIGEYLPTGPVGDDAGLRYVVFRETFVRPSEQTFPDPDARHIFAGTSVERYADAEELIADQYSDAEFRDANHEWDMYWKLRDCGFEFASRFYQSLSPGDAVRFTDDPEGDAFLARVQGEVGEVIALEGDERVQVRFDHIESPDDPGEPAEVLTMAHGLDQP